MKILERLCAELWHCLNSITNYDSKCWDIVCVSKNTSWNIKFIANANYKSSDELFPINIIFSRKCAKHCRFFRAWFEIITRKRKRLNKILSPIASLPLAGREREIEREVGSLWQIWRMIIWYYMCVNVACEAWFSHRKSKVHDIISFSRYNIWNWSSHKMCNAVVVHRSCTGKTWMFTQHLCQQLSEHHSTKQHTEARAWTCWTNETWARLSGKFSKTFNFRQH